MIYDGVRFFALVFGIGQAAPIMLYMCWRWPARHVAAGGSQTERVLDTMNRRDGAGRISSAFLGSLFSGKTGFQRQDHYALLSGPPVLPRNVKNWCIAESIVLLIGLPNSSCPCLECVPEDRHLAGELARGPLNNYARANQPT